MNILVTTCARGGSKGIPGKNVKHLNGKPLIAYTIEAGLQFCQAYDGDFDLSTDNEQIKTVAAEYGLHTNYQRPAKLATDTAGKVAAIRDLLFFKEKEQQKRYDFLLDMDVTSPLRNFDDLKGAFEQLQADPEAYNIFSLSPASRNPYFNMLEEKEDGYLKVVKSGKKIKSRQMAPAVYDMNASFCIFRRKFFEEKRDISKTEKSIGYVVPHSCFDLDHPTDFTIMEIMMRENLLDFEL